jgi:hypothetical protein
MVGLCGRIAAFCAAMVLCAFAPLAGASFHLWKINEIYSDASGNVQYVEFFTDSAFQEFLTFLGTDGLKASQGGNTHSYTFGTDLPATPQHTTQNQKFLVATQGFADLNIVAPDYIVPNGFMFMPGGTIAFGIYDSVTYSGLGSNGTRALDRNGVVVATTPTNFAGTTGCVSVPPPTPAGVFDVDSNGVIDAMTDGLLLVRYTLNVRGAALIAGALGPCAGRNTATAIETYLGGQIPQ